MSGVGALPRLVVALGLGLLCASLGGSVAAAQAGEPAAVVTAYEMARNRGDLDIAASYFADDGTLQQRSTVYTGKQEILRYLQAAAGRGRFVVISNRKLNGNALTWLERPAGQNINGIEINVEATVHDGKIKSLSYNGVAAPVRSEANAEGRSPLPALLGMAAVVLVISGLILVVSTGLPHSRTPQSSLHGRMLQDLRVWRAARGLSG
jgi:hypothetical protein